MKRREIPPWSNTRPPRKWQAEALPTILDAVESQISGLVQACTGAGKSNVIREVCAAFIPTASAPIIVSTPTERLVEDLAEAIAERVLPFGAKVGRYYGQRKQLRAPVIVACNPSLDALAAELEVAGRRPALWIVDEAHNSESPQVLAVGQGAWADVVRVGFTATPYRADEAALSLFERLLYAYKIGDAVADGVVVPFRVVKWTGDPTTEINAACLEMIRSALAAHGGPGVVDAASIADAKAFAAYLTDHGIEAEPIHCALPRTTVKRRMAQLLSGKIKVAVHVAMLKEGVDMPALRWLVMRRPVGSRTWIAQHVGRVLRTHPGKDLAWVYDPHDLLGKFSLSYEACLAGGAEEPTPPPLPEPQVPRKPSLKEMDPRTVTREPKTVNAVEGWIGAVRIAYENAGLVVGKDVPLWLTQDPTQAQLSSLRSVGAQLARGHLPPNDLPPEFIHELRVAYSAANKSLISRGLMTAFLSVLFAVNRQGLPPSVKLALGLLAPPPPEPKPSAPNPTTKPTPAKPSAGAKPSAPAKPKKALRGPYGTTTNPAPPPARIPPPAPLPNPAAPAPQRIP